MDEIILWEQGAGRRSVVVPRFPKQRLSLDRRVEAEYSSLIFCLGGSYGRKCDFRSRVFERFTVSNKHTDSGSKAEYLSRQQLLGHWGGSVGLVTSV